jgi:hypothetical protein
LRDSINKIERKKFWKELPTSVPFVNTDHTGKKYGGYIAGHTDA